MKKTLLLAAAIVMSALTLSAKGHFGVVAGVNNAQMPISGVSNSGMWGFTGGAAYHHDFALGFAIQPELVYDTKGTDWVSEDFKNNIRVGYVELPVQLQWGPDLVLFRPYFFAEPFIGLAVAGRFNDQATTLLSGNMKMSDMKSAFEYGIGVGIGFDFARHFQLSAKYYWNLEEFDYKSDGVWVFSDPDMLPKTARSFRGVTIKLGVFF